MLAALSKETLHARGAENRDEVLGQTARNPLGDPQVPALLETDVIIDVHHLALVGLHLRIHKKPITLIDQLIHGGRINSRSYKQNRKYSTRKKY